MIKRLLAAMLMFSPAVSAYPEGSTPTLTGPRITLSLTGTNSYLGTAAVRDGFVAGTSIGDLSLRTTNRFLISVNDGQNAVLDITSGNITSFAPMTAPSFSGTINGISASALSASVAATTLATNTNNPNTLVKRDDGGAVTVERVQFGDGTVQTTASRPRRSPQQVALLQWFTTNDAIQDYTFGTNVQPFAMAWDGEWMWISGSGGVIALDRNMQTVRTAPIADLLAGLAFDGEYVWTAGYTTNQVFVLSRTGAPVPLPTGGTGPQYLAFDGACMWVTLAGSNSVAKMNSRSGAVVASYPVAGRPAGIAFDGTSMWIASETANTLTKIRASDGANLGSVSTGAGPYAVAFDGTYIWVTNSGANTVSRFRASDGAGAGTFTVGTSPYGLAFDGENIWVIGSERTVSVLRATDGALVRTSQIVQNYARNIAFDGVRMWITVPNANAISRR